MKKALILLFIFILSSLNSNAQGISNFWLIGYTTVLDSYTTSTKANIDFISGIPNVFPISRKMKFSETQGNICDLNGHLLMASNGLWIANALNDTMLNGGGLNPGPFTQAWPNYLPMANCKDRKSVV